MTVPRDDLQGSVQSLARCEAITLFVERAATIVPDFSLAGANHAALSSICHCLYGIALTIELTAMQLAVMLAEQILQKLKVPRAC